MEEGLRSNSRRLNASVLADGWKQIGRRASLCSESAFGEIATRLRSLTVRQALSGSLREHAVELFEPSSLIFVLDWEFDERPAVAVSTHALTAPIEELQKIYPNGLIALAADADHGLLVEFNGDVTTLELLRAAPAR